ncbi:hypothetical protein TIFTF001_032251 [Ficus carica]|uniref:Uncharacterized protein n=1 Tax=Ficus carica TaxID=3494 RepID=A0AA88J269_FICCA|nr:hypothetical protein TIFTF001_032251 [Ficus carica]
MWRVESGEALHCEVYVVGEREPAVVRVEETRPGRGLCTPSASVREDRWSPRGWAARSRRHLERIELRGSAWLSGWDIWASFLGFF